MADRFSACSIEGCNGNAHYTARGRHGLCCSHYHRLKRHGDPLGGGKIRGRSGTRSGPCKVAGCDGRNEGSGASKGYCRRHYMRFWKYGDPLAGGKAAVRHGMYGTPIYSVWNGMLGRCGHKRSGNASDMRNYRDRGIRVCHEWLDPRVFAEWAKRNGYAEHLTIDRIDSDLGYEPGNCRWIPLRENLRAKKNIRLSIEIAREIRNLRATTNLSLSKIGSMFGTDPSSVSKIARGLLWAE